MWQCRSCEFWNDEAADSCVRCHQERAETPSGERAAPEVAGGEQPRRGRWGRLEWIAAGVIAVCVLALAGLGYLAWQRGLIDLNLDWLKRGSEEGATVAGGSFEVDIVQLEEDAHPLAGVYTDSLRSLKRLRPWADYVLEAQARLEELAEPAEWGEELPAEAVAYRGAAAGIAVELLERYADFEAYAAKYDDQELKPYQQLVRNEFVDRLGEALTAIGAVYAHDPVGQDSAYSLSDKAVAAVAEHAPEQAERLREVWGDAIYGRAQFLLDIEQQEEYRQLSARLEGVIELHRGFQTSLNELPPYNIRGGKLDKHGRATLELLDALAVQIEEVTLDFEEYRAGLNEALLSDRNRGLLIRIDDLCMEDHLYAFTEVYRIYAQDRELDHAAYGALAAHFDFVLQHWPRQEMAYRRVYNQYEAAWAALWTD